MRRAFLFTLCTLVLLLVFPIKRQHDPVPAPPQGTLRCAIPPQDASFHRALVHRYIQDENLDMILQVGPVSLDSLMSGAIDLAVVPAGADSLYPNLVFSRPFADGTVWALRADETEGLRRVNRWITELSASERFNKMQKRYLSGKRASLNSISEYDNLLRHSADSIGWDWRLIAAVVYHESRFHNEANSSKGAIGLMQIRSSRYTEEELLNPARNLSIGTRYLRKLENMFPAAGPMDSLKFALAAFNIGEGKVARLAEEAEKAGLDPTRWDEVARMLPEGHHTIAYVNNVLDTYSYYTQLYPR